MDGCACIENEDEFAVQSRRTTTMDNGIDIACGHAPWHLFLTIALVIILESLTLRPLIYSDLRV